jgi:hypothetical protein
MPGPVVGYVIFSTTARLVAKASNNITPLDLPFNYNSKT